MSTTGKRDYYEVLGVERDASDAEIKRAYRKLGRQYHPDVNPDNPEVGERFKEISEAYAVLSNPERRARYDRYGHDGRGEFGYGPATVDIFDMFASVFGGDPFGFGSRTGRQVQVGRDLRYDLEIDLEEVLTGAEHEIRFTRQAACETCDGTGAKPGTSPKSCPTCGGMGQVRSARNTFIGTISTVQTCPHCSGEGQVIEEPCEACHGRAVARREETLTIRVPQGVVTGNELLLRGFGEAPVGGGQAGDLHVRFIVRDHERFVRNGDDLLAELPISMVQAALGDTVVFEGLDGEVQVEVPPGTQPGSEFVLHGRGLPHLNSTARGNLRLRTNVQIPRNLTPHQRELLLAFASECGEDVTPADPGLFQRILNAISGQH